jgi:hypothetical protein
MPEDGLDSHMWAFHRRHVEPRPGTFSPSGNYLFTEGGWTLAVTTDSMVAVG